MPEPTPLPAAPPEGEPTVVAARRTANLEPGTILGNTYRIEALLARGGMGEVYRAAHVELGSTHAIKIILPALADDPKMVQLLIEEARKLSRLRNDAIVDYQGLFRDEHGLRYLVMEFVEGESLASILASRRLTPQEVLSLRDRLAQGLAAAHEKGIVHRDISPDNIILPGGDVRRAKLIDFGIAKALDAPVTLIGTDFAGKYAYASPEQVGLFGGQVGPRSDIYSLGLVLAAAATGKRLEMGDSPSSVIAAREQLPDLSAVPAALRAAIAPMLAPRPEERPASLPILPAGPGEPSQLRRKERGSPKRWAALAVAAAVLAAALAGLFVFRAAIWPPSVATVRGELAAATAGYRCAALEATVAEDRSARIVGHAATPADIARLRRAVGRIAGIGTIDFDVALMRWPYCRAVDLLKPYLNRPRAALPRVALTNPPAYIGERLSLSVGMPNFDGYLYVDYFAAEGKVRHLLPNDRDRLNIKPAHNRLTVGQPPMRSCWILGGGTGRQLVTVIAARRPLFRKRQPETEGAGDYLDSLSRALAKPDQAAASAAALFFDLHPARPQGKPVGCPS